MQRPSVRWPHRAHRSQQPQFGDAQAETQTAFGKFMYESDTRRGADPRYDERKTALDLLAQLGGNTLIQP